MIGENREAFFYALVQRMLFPHDAVSGTTREAFFDLALSNNLTDSLAHQYWIASSADNLPEKVSDRGIGALKLLVRLQAGMQKR